MSLNYKCVRLYLCWTVDYRLKSTNNDKESAFTSLMTSFRANRLIFVPVHRVPPFCFRSRFSQPSCKMQWLCAMPTVSIWTIIETSNDNRDVENDSRLSELIELQSSVLPAWCMTFRSIDVIYKTLSRKANCSIGLSSSRELMNGG